VNHRSRGEIHRMRLGIAAVDYPEGTLIVSNVEEVRG